MDSLVDINGTLRMNTRLLSAGVVDTVVWQRAWHGCQGVIGNGENCYIFLRPGRLIQYLPHTSISLIWHDGIDDKSLYSDCVFLTTSSRTTGANGFLSQKKQKSENY